jgi:hypothetical protein
MKYRIKAEWDYISKHYWYEGYKPFLKIFEKCIGDSYSPTEKECIEKIIEIENKKYDNLNYEIDIQ